MKTPSDDLFTLVKSLDTREKIFFKIYSANKGSGSDSLSYLKLFDTIDKLKYFDESVLKARLEKIGFKHHLNQAKNYLANAILNSLREYHSDISANAQIQKLLHTTEVLLKKRLNGLAKKILLKAEKLATEHELYDCLVSIYSLKETALMSEVNIKDMDDYMDHLLRTETHYSERLKNVTEFRNLLYRVRLIMAKYAGKAAGNDLHKINSIIASPILSSPANALSFSALKNYYLIHILCAHLSGKWNNAAYNRQKEWVTYLESDKTKQVERADIYLGALMDFMAIQIRTIRMDEAEKLYEKIKHFYFSLPLKKRSKSLFQKLAATTSNYMVIHTQKGNPEKSLKAWGQIKNYVSANTINPNTFLLICDNLSSSYFMLENYHDALKWINKILNIGEKNALDLQAMARVYLLLVHYELGNYKMLPHIAKSSQRFLVKHHYFSEFEKIMVAFFKKKINDTNDNQKQSIVFGKLKKQLDVLLKDSKQIEALEHFDYISWIKSKIENRPFIDVIREKSKKVIF